MIKIYKSTVILFFLLLCFVLYILLKKGKEGFTNLEGYSVYDKSQLYEFEDLLTKEECDRLIEYGKHKVEDSGVICERGETCKTDHRTSKNVFLKDEELDVIEKITKQVERYMKIDRSHFEDLQFVHYDKNQEYKEHYDPCVGEGRCESFLKKGGQRFATFIIYLNDDFVGGETNFPNRNVKVIPKVGKGVLFFSLEDDNETIREDSLHAGMPVLRGEKYMCNKWIRVKSYQ